MKEQINVEKIDYLIKYLELLVKVHGTGLKMHHEINMAIKQLERDMQLDGSSYIVVQNGEILIKNCVFNPLEGEHGISLIGDKLSLNGIKVQDKSKLTVSGNTIAGASDEHIEKLIEQGNQKDGTFDVEVLNKLKTFGVTLEFLSSGIRWKRN